MKTAGEQWKEIQETSTVVQEYEGKMGSSVTLEISGKLADDIRTRFGIEDDSTVFIEEDIISGYFSSEVWTMEFILTVECDTHRKLFASHESEDSFKQLLEWLEATSKINSLPSK